MRIKDLLIIISILILGIIIHNNFITKSQNYVIYKVNFKDLTPGGILINPDEKNQFIIIYKDYAYKLPYIGYFGGGIKYHNISFYKIEGDKLLYLGKIEALYEYDYWNRRRECTRYIKEESKVELYLEKKDNQTIKYTFYLSNNTVLNYTREIVDKIPEDALCIKYYDADIIAPEEAVQKIYNLLREYEGDLKINKIWRWAFLQKEGPKKLLLTNVIQDDLGIYYIGYAEIVPKVIGELGIYKIPLSNRYIVVIPKLDPEEGDVFIVRLAYGDIIPIEKIYVIDLNTEKIVAIIKPAKDKIIVTIDGEEYVIYNITNLRYLISDEDYILNTIYNIINENIKKIKLQTPPIIPPNIKTIILLSKNNEVIPAWRTDLYQNISKIVIWSGYPNIPSYYNRTGVLALITKFEYKEDGNITVEYIDLNESCPKTYIEPLRYIFPEKVRDVPFDEIYIRFITYESEGDIYTFILTMPKTFYNESIHINFTKASEVFGEGKGAICRVNIPTPFSVFHINETIFIYSVMYGYWYFGYILIKNKSINPLQSIKNITVYASRGVPSTTLYMGILPIDAMLGIIDIYRAKEQLFIDLLESRINISTETFYDPIFGITHEIFKLIYLNDLDFKTFLINLSSGEYLIYDNRERYYVIKMFSKPHNVFYIFNLSIQLPRIIRSVEYATFIKEGGNVSGFRYWAGFFYDIERLYEMLRDFVFEGGSILIMHNINRIKIYKLEKPSIVEYKGELFDVQYDIDFDNKILTLTINNKLSPVIDSMKIKVYSGSNKIYQTTFVDTSSPLELVLNLPELDPSKNTYIEILMFDNGILIRYTISISPEIPQKQRVSVGPGYEQIVVKPTENITYNITNITKIEEVQQIEEAPYGLQTVIAFVRERPLILLLILIIILLIIYLMREGK